MRVKELKGQISSNPPLGPFVGGEYARRDRAASAFGDGVRVMANSRRVLATVGLHGSERFQIVSLDPDSDTQIYPTVVAVRHVARRRFRLTPGHFPHLSALVVPSGETQKVHLDGEGTPDGWESSGAGGAIYIEVDYDNGVDTDSASWIKYLPVSGKVFAGENLAPAAAWTQITRIQLGPCAPGDVVGNLADLRKWSENVTVTMRIAYIGGVRCVDLCVQELPIAYARDNFLDDPDWIVPMLASAAKIGDPDVMPEFPVDALSATDASAGTELLATAARRQQAELGPILAEWSGWDEETQAVTALEAAGVSTSSSTFVDLLQTAITSWSDANPGWSVSSGGNAREHLTSSHLRELRDLDACVRVRIWIYASRTVSGTSVVRFTSQRYAVGEIAVTSSTDQWWSTTAHLRCGLGAQDESVLQVLGKASGGGALTVKYLIVEHLPG